jgi:hypothetical protein
MAPTLVRHSTASGWVKGPSSVVRVGVPVRRIGASARCSHRLASAARAGPKRKDWDRVRPGAVEAGHDVFGAAPVVDGLGGVADHDQLGVVALVEEDLFDDGVGVLGFVQQQEVGVEFRLGEGPDLEVVVVVEADGAIVWVL